MSVLCVSSRGSKFVFKSVVKYQQPLDRASSNGERPKISVFVFDGHLLMQVGIDRKMSEEITAMTISSTVSSAVVVLSPNTHCYFVGDGIFAWTYYCREKEFCYFGPRAYLSILFWRSQRDRADWQQHSFSRIWRMRSAPKQFMCTRSGLKTDCSNEAALSAIAIVFGRSNFRSAGFVRARASDPNSACI